MMINHVLIYFSAVQIFDIHLAFICTIKFLHSTWVPSPAGSAPSSCRALDGIPAIVKAKDLV